MMAENFPNLGRNFDIGVDKAKRSPQNFNTKWFSLRHIIVKLSKTKDTRRILKAVRENKFSYKGTLLRLSADFSPEIL